MPPSASQLVSSDQMSPTTRAVLALFGAVARSNAALPHLHTHLQQTVGRSAAQTRHAVRANLVLGISIAGVAIYIVLLVARAVAGLAHARQRPPSKRGAASSSKPTATAQQQQQQQHRRTDLKQLIKESKNAQRA